MWQAMALNAGNTAYTVIASNSESTTIRHSPHCKWSFRPAIGMAFFCHELHPRVHDDSTAALHLLKENLRGRPPFDGCGPADTRCAPPTASNS